LQGQKTLPNGKLSRTGVPAMVRFYPKGHSRSFTNVRGPVNEPILISGDTKDFRLERNIFQTFSEVIRREDFPDGGFDYPDLPAYDAFGPNSNGFVQYLLNAAGGIRLKGNDGVPGHPGLNTIDPYYDHIHTQGLPDDGQN
jgi:hypothetical protein